jgi:hypothetical protein
MTECLVSNSHDLDGLSYNSILGNYISGIYSLSKTINIYIYSCAQTNLVYSGRQPYVNTYCI